MAMSTCSCVKDRQSTMRVNLWIAVTLLPIMQAFVTNDDTEDHGYREKGGADKGSGPPETMIRPENLKIFFVPKEMEKLSSLGASEKLNLYAKHLGTSLKLFQENTVNGRGLVRHIRSIVNYTSSISDETLDSVHALVKRQARNYVVHCCGSWSCSYSSRQNMRRLGYGYGYNGYPDANRGTSRFGNVAVAVMLPQGVSISCSGCVAGWQQQLNFGHGVGWIPITCPRCPDDWKERLNMGDFADDRLTSSTETTTSEYYYEESTDDTAEISGEQTTTEEPSAEESTNEVISESTTHSATVTSSKSATVGTRPKRLLVATTQVVIHTTGVNHTAANHTTTANPTTGVTLTTASLRTTPATRPAGISLPAGVKLPAGVSLPAGVTLPAGFKLPANLPAGLPALPPGLDLGALLG